MRWQTLQRLTWNGSRGLEGIFWESHEQSACSTCNSVLETSPEAATAETTAQRAPRCARCGSDPAAHAASSDYRLMLHMGQKHSGQRLLSESIGQLRHLDRGACVVCGAVRSRRCNRCSFCNSRTPLWELRVGDTFQDRQQPGHQDVARGSTSSDQQLLQSSQPEPPGEPLDDSPLPNCPIRNIVLTDRDKQLLSELRRASAVALPRCVVSRHATAWAESLEGGMSGHQSWALLCRYRCRLLLAEIPEGIDRNSELKQRLKRWESVQINALIGLVLGQQNSRPLRRTTGRSAAADGRTAWEASLCLDSPRIHQQSHEGIGRRCCAGFSAPPQELDHSPHSAELEHWNSTHQRGVCRGGPDRRGRRAIETGAERDEGAGTEQNRHRFAASRQTVAHECPGPTSARQEHLDAGAGQRRRLFRGLDILTIKWATGDLPEECRFLLNTQLMFLMKEKTRPRRRPDLLSQADDRDDMDFSAPRISRLSAPQLQAQLSRVADQTRLRRLKDTL